MTRKTYRAEKLALITKWLRQAEDEKKLHPGQEQCWNCGNWYAIVAANDPFATAPDTCPHCDTLIPPF
jgi:hypothetical protein